MIRSVIGLIVIGAVGCGASADPSPPPVAPSHLESTNGMGPAAASAASSASPAPSAALSVSPSVTAQADAPPDEIEYPFKGLDMIPDDCKEASVVLTTAPTRMGWDYDWMWTRQALFANPQFQIVEGPGAPPKPMQLRLDMYEIPGGFALVGVCKDGATCNKAAAMYKATVPTCSPKLYCGPLPIPGSARKPRLVPADGQWLPATVVGQCARIGVCLSITHQRVGKNPGVECQANPSKFHIECAKKATCDEVAKCALTQAL